MSVAMTSQRKGSQSFMNSQASFSCSISCFSAFRSCKGQSSLNISMYMQDKEQRSRTAYQVQTFYGKLLVLLLKLSTCWDSHYLDYSDMVWQNQAASQSSHFAIRLQGFVFSSECELKPSPDVLMLISVISLPKHGETYGSLQAFLHVKKFHINCKLVNSVF